MSYTTRVLLHPIKNISLASTYEISLTLISSLTPSIHLCGLPPFLVSSAIPLYITLTAQSSTVLSTWPYLFERLPSMRISDASLHHISFLHFHLLLLSIVLISTIPLKLSISTLLTSYCTYPDQYKPGFQSYTLKFR